MLFLIEYERRKGRLVTNRRFDDAQREEAERARLELELRVNREGVEHEVVLLEAASEEALRTTHQRYFEKLADVAKAIEDTLN
jgi:hypothetical protein